MSLIDPQLAAILVCPVDKADLTEDEARLAGWSARNVAAGIPSETGYP